MRLAAIIMMSVALSGCKKRTDVFMFDCVIHDQRIDAAVADADVTMLVQRAAGGFNPNYQTVGSTTTDANGRFYVEVDKDVFYSYRLEVTHGQYFNGTFDIDPDDVPISTAYAATFNLEPKAWVSVHLLNQFISQTVSFSINADSDNCSDCCDWATAFISGWPVDSTITCQLYGGQNVEVTGNYVDINGGVHLVSEQVFALAFDTTVVEVVY